MNCDDIRIKIGRLDCNGVELSVGDRVKTTRIFHLPSEDGWERDIPRITRDMPQTDVREGTIIYCKMASSYFVFIDEWAKFPIIYFDKIEKISHEMD